MKLKSRLKLFIMLQPKLVVNFILAGILIMIMISVFLHFSGITNAASQVENKNKEIQAAETYLLYEGAIHTQSGHFSVVSYAQLERLVSGYKFSRQDSGKIVSTASADVYILSLTTQGRQDYYFSYNGKYFITSDADFEASQTYLQSVFNAIELKN